MFNNYNFGYVSKYIDELVILNVEGESVDWSRYFENVQFVLDNVFVPVALGGGIRDLETARRCFEVGADKIVLNTSVHTNPGLIEEVARVFGAQAVVASVDYRREDNRVYIENGKRAVEDQPLEAYLTALQGLPIGEVLLTSIEKDGTGFGFDTETIQRVLPHVQVPLIVAGGAGKKDHFLEVAHLDGVDAFCTANLLNFIGEALPDTRRHLVENAIPLAHFDL